MLLDSIISHWSISLSVAQQCLLVQPYLYYYGYSATALRIQKVRVGIEKVRNRWPLIETVKKDRFPEAHYPVAKRAAVGLSHPVGAGPNVTEKNDLSITRRGGYLERYSPESVASGHAGPRRILASSLSAGWTSLLVQKFESLSTVEPFETLTTPDQLVVVRTKGHCTLGSFSNGNWRWGEFRPGFVGMTAGGCANRLCWRSQIPATQESIHIHIPQHFLAGAEEEFRRAGVSTRKEPLDTLSSYDPTISRMAHSLMDAVKAGAPNLYAEAAAQFLATHLLSRQTGSAAPAQEKRQAGTLSTRRLAHVLEYMNTNLADALSLNQLANEAGVTRFHFGRLFKAKVGVTPHRHLVNIRMEAAASLLAKTQLSVLEIALACGYQSGAHFTAAFQKHFTQTPSSYRLGVQTGSSE